MMKFFFDFTIFKTLFLIMVLLNTYINLQIYEFLRNNGLKFVFLVSAVWPPLWHGVTLSFVNLFYGGVSADSD